jgi:hypothetical protein
LETPDDLRVLGLVAQIKLFKHFQLYSVVVSALAFGFIAADPQPVNVPQAWMRQFMIHRKVLFLILTKAMLHNQQFAYCFVSY